MRRSIQITLGLVALGTLIGALLMSLQTPAQPRAFREAAAVFQIRGPARVEAKILDLVRRLRPGSPSLANESPLKRLLATVLEQDLDEIAAKDRLIILVDSELAPGQPFPEVREFDPENRQGNVQLSGKDIALQINVSVIREKLSAQIDSAMGLFQASMNANGDRDATKTKPFGDLAVFLEASKTLFLSIDLRDDGLVVHGSRQVVDTVRLNSLDGDSDAMLKLPAGYDFYFKKVIERPLDPGEGSEWVEQVSFGDLERSLTVTRCSRPESLTREWVEKMKATPEDSSKAGSSLVLDARRYREFILHSVEQDRNEMPPGDVLNQLEKRLGRALSKVVIQMVQNLLSEPRTIWCGHRSDLHVEISAPGWVEARQILDAYLEPRTALSDDVFAVESLRMLPDRSTDLRLVRSRPLVDTILKSMRAAGGASPRDARVDKAAPRPFAGVAFSRRGSREAVDAWIPVDAVKCVIEFVEQSRRLIDSKTATNGADGR